MTLSSLFQKPALTALISGGVTNSVVTASPAILLGICAGGVQDTSDGFYYDYQIYNGTDTIIRSGTTTSWGTAVIAGISPNGIDCPNGITVSTISNVGGAGGLNRARLSIFYILK